MNKQAATDVTSRPQEGPHATGNPVMYPPSGAPVQYPRTGTPLMYPPTDPAGTSTVWGSPRTQAAAPGKRRGTRRHTWLAAGVAVVVAGGGVAAVQAARNGSATTAGQTNGQADGLGIPGAGTGAEGGAGGPAGGLAGALHGEYVLADGGSYVTMLVQTGEITALGTTEITVKSADGVSLSYGIGTGTTVSKANTAQGGQGGPPCAASANAAQSIVVQAAAAAVN